MILVIVDFLNSEIKERVFRETSFCYGFSELIINDRSVQD